MRIPSLKSKIADWWGKKKQKFKKNPSWFYLFFLTILVFAVLYAQIDFSSTLKSLEIADILPHILLIVFLISIIKFYLYDFFIQEKRTFLSFYETLLNPLFIGFATLILSINRTAIELWLLFLIIVLFSIFIFWLYSFDKEENLFQVFWIRYLGIKKGKIFILILLSLFIIPIVGEYQNIQVITENFGNILIRNLSYATFTILVMLSGLHLSTDTNQKSLLKYNNMCLDLVRDRFPEGNRERISRTTEEFVHVFPEIIRNTNKLQRKYHLDKSSFKKYFDSKPPKILIKDIYPKKLLIADSLQDKDKLDNQEENRLRRVKGGLVDIERSFSDEKPDFFGNFVNGLKRIANSGEDEEKFEIDDLLELKPPRGATGWIKDHQTKIVIMLTAVFGIINLIAQFT